MKASFQGIGDLPGGSFLSSAASVSGDGSTVVGSSSITEDNFGAFRWTAETGLVDFRDLIEDELVASVAFGVSRDGSVVSGTDFREDSANPELLIEEAFIWTAATGRIGLGDLPGGEFLSFSENISSDGLVVVGHSPSANGTEAWRWTAQTGIVGLGDLPGGGFESFATGISADGSVIVGRGTGENGIEAFRWTEETGLVPLGDLPGGNFLSLGVAVSADGSIIVGNSSSENSMTEDGGGLEAFIWREETGLVGLGDLPGGAFL